MTVIVVFSESWRECFPSTAPTRNIKQWTGESEHSHQFQMLPLDLIIGFNNDEGLEAIVDLLMDPTNDTNFAQVLINI